MSDDRDELDAALRRAMAALDGEVPAGYFEALPGRTRARLEDPEISELPGEPGWPLRAVRPPADQDDKDEDGDDGAVFASQIMAAVELPEVDELAEPAQRGALPRHDRASASSAIMRAVPVDADGDLGEIRVAGSDLGVTSASSITVLPVAPIEPGPRAAAAVDVRSPGAGPSMTEADRGRRRRRVRAAIVAIGGIGLAAVAVMYLAAGDRASRSAPSILSSGGPASPSEPAVASPSAGRGSSSSAGSAAVASGPGSGSAATTAGAAAGSGVAPGVPSDTVSEPVGKFGPPVKRPGGARPPSKAGVEKPQPQLAPGTAGKGRAKQVAPPDNSGVPGKKLKSIKPRPDRASLSGDDIERAMTAVAGAARACVAGTRGTLSLRLTVAPSGRIARVAVTGPFAGTPEGACVERTVRTATFPPWSGAAQSFDYSYPPSD